MLPTHVREAIMTLSDGSLAVDYIYRLTWTAFLASIIALFHGVYSMVK